MEFIAGLFGIETDLFTMLVALAIVLVLIVLTVWLLKVLGQTTRSLGRGRQKRLAIVDSISIDQKRQAVIVRRDEIEHLIVIGGPNDLVIESGFEAPPVPVAPARPARRVMPVPPVAAPEVRDESSTPRSKPKSLRHTGLLRANDETGDELPGGKLEPTAAQFSDSDTSETGAGLEPELETVAEAGDSDTADNSKGRRN